MAEKKAVPRLGGFFEGDAVRFRIWAPERRGAEVVLFTEDGRAEARAIPMEAEPGGFFTATAPRAGRVFYKIRVDGEGPYPDPYSRAQPLGVHGPSEVVELKHAWTDAGWQGVPLEALVVYEVHVGTATPEGTFEALIPRLGELRALGVTAIELMPIASWPGQRNWGYDGVALYAPPEPYGGPAGLMRLVDAAHAAGMAVIVDAVYNHLGPDGNYLGCYSSRYFTDRHETPWGGAVNYDGEDAAPVRELVAANAEMWIRDYHVDGLRLDATHAIHDDSAPHILQEIADRARAAGGGRQVLVIAEDDDNDVRLLRPKSEGGYGLDGVWTGDFHHMMRRLFAGDKDGYYEDFEDSMTDLAATLNQGWLYVGQFARHFGGPRGTSPLGIPTERFVWFIQNHDQIGNRAFGDRLGPKVGPAAYRAISALFLLSPYTPLLFMGQEWNSEQPFQFFTDHDAELGKLVTEGRRREFKAFAAFAHSEIPDPQAEATFLRSKLPWDERDRPAHREVLALYGELLRLRREHPALRERARGSFSARAISDDALVLERRGGGKVLTVVMNRRGSLTCAIDPSAGSLRGARALLATEEPRFGGATPLERAFDGGMARLDGPGVVVVESDG